uniref:Retrovirus-related Pol polyprotein from transposon TNT 1-94 n=1 Tax=Tanacetum cinerariifolium TaxID=118510 RepID=A0A6L2MZM5_TANCI|nr:retrovirus-related Pol polyprotein from transposon TNT 1-94 [Tanacetum cinerariifolium]
MTNLRNEISNFQQRFDESFHEAWGHYKDLLRACPHYGFTELHQIDTFYNALNPADQYSLNSAASGNLLERQIQDVLTIIKNKSKVRNSRNISIVSQVKLRDANSSSSFEIAKLTHVVNQQTSDVTTSMTAILKQFQATPPLAPVKSIEEIYVTCVGSSSPSYPLSFNINKENQQEKDEIQIHKFWQMFKQLHINISLADALILIPKYQKMLKALRSNKENFLELANTPLNENCSTVILMKLLEKLGDPRKFLISCGFSKLKCKALDDLGATINLMPLSVWKKLGLPELISTHMTLELANRAIYTPAGIARDVFVRVGKFTFPADFVIVVIRTILESPSSWEDLSYGPLDYLKDLFATSHLSGNPTFSSHTDLTSPKVINLLSGNTTSSSPDHLLEEFADELTLITFPPRDDDLPFNIESDLREIEYLLNHEPTKEMDSILEDSVDESNLVDPNNDLVDTIPEMFTDEHTLDYSSSPIYDDVDDDLVKLESNNDEVYDDPFDSKEDKIKEYKLLIDELDPPRSSDFLPSLEYDSVLYEYFSRLMLCLQPITRTKYLIPGNPQIDLQDKVVIESGCSRHMTRTMSYLTDYKEIVEDMLLLEETPKEEKSQAKDESIAILKTFITGIENLVDHKVKVIRCDDGTEFKKRDIHQFCEMKEVVNAVCYVQNIVLVVMPHNKTPYELFNGRTPSLSFMRPFGCPVTILNTKDHLGKFNGKTDEGFFVGYSLNGKAFRVFNSRTRIVEENLHIRFSGNTPNIVGSGPDWFFDIDALTRTMNYKPIVAGIQSNNFAGSKANDNAGHAMKEKAHSSQDDGFQPLSDHGKKVDEDPRQESKCKDQEKEYNVNSTNNDISTFNFSSDHEDDDEMADMNNLDTTIKEELLQFKLQEVWTLVDLPNVKRAIGIKWVFRNKKDERGIVITNKARLVAQGHTQEEGINYDEVIAQVTDVKSDFLYEKIEEEVYVCKPLGFKDLEFLDKVYKVEKALYGQLKLVEHVYVDDIIFGLTKKESCNAFEKMMHEKFQMSSMGELTFFLRLKVKQKQDGIFISQDKYVAEILKKYEFTKIKNARKPMETQKPLLKDKDDEEIDVHMYRSMIGSLMYVISSRPDIMFVVCVCARYQVNPKVSHLHAVKRMFKYLKGQPKIGLWYPKDSLFDLIAYNNSEYARASFDRKSTTEDEAVNEEMDDSLVKATTTVSSSKAEQDSDNINKTQSNATLNEPSFIRTSSVNTPQSDEDSLKLFELMELCTNLQNIVLELENTKTTQALEIDSLKRRVKKLKKKQRSRTYVDPKSRSIL